MKTEWKNGLIEFIIIFGILLLLLILGCTLKELMSGSLFQFINF